jgi:hypothetical protein
MNRRKGQLAGEPGFVFTTLIRRAVGNRSIELRARSYAFSLIPLSVSAATASSRMTP